MLRVRLDCCSTRGGLTLFDGEPLCGVGAAVGSESVVRGRSAGVVTLWLYDAGVRAEAWVEPWLADDWGTIIDDMGNFDSTDGTGATIYDGERLDGLLASFHGPFLVRLATCADGERMSKSTVWRDDGSIHKMHDYVTVNSRGVAYQVTAGASWGDRNGGPAREAPATAVSSGFVRGVLRSSRRIEPQFAGDEFSPVKFMMYPGADARSGFHLRLDENGHIAEVGLQRPEHFEVLAMIGVAPAPLSSWHVRSLSELSRFGIGRELELGGDTPDDSLDRIVDAVGGYEAFGPVASLRLRSYGLRPDQIAALLAAPSLVDVQITENEHDRQPGRGIRALAQALKDRRPDTRVVFDKQVLEPAR